MSKTSHRLFLASFVLIVLLVLIYLIITGSGFYRTSIEERFFHPLYQQLKPSGSFGHGYGIFGSFFILLGVIMYMLRKRFRPFFRLGSLKYWLEFHIFLCTLGPVLVLFHTSFKFGGIVAISFWSMVAVFLSGIVGRFIYIQIPRNIEGKELSLSEVKNMRTDAEGNLNDQFNLEKERLEEINALLKNKVGIYRSNFFERHINIYFDDRKTLKTAKSIISKSNLTVDESKNVTSMIKKEIAFNRKIERYTSMQNLLKHWHVAHLPFAFIMLIVMIIHVVITIMFGSRWIF